eukprot:gnl/Dysnectes_brevis/3751_a4815_620.p1 GENE.gnl/Dysnectes_brevis/3751_a4815_620~~gnl/Dysnectes_brevis/3751_a4815_620.p1  ORF type:complete len:238 (+),score=57.29 gnl/Dysnectes_brevis/3751_a4815_620:104-817(+)
MYPNQLGPNPSKPINVVHEIKPVKRQRAPIANPFTISETKQFVPTLKQVPPAPHTEQKPRLGRGRRHAAVDVTNRAGQTTHMQTRGWRGIRTTAPPPPSVEANPRRILGPGIPVQHMAEGTAVHGKKHYRERPDCPEWSFHPRAADRGGVRACPHTEVRDPFSAGQDRRLSIKPRAGSQHSHSEVIHSQWAPSPLKTKRESRPRPAVNYTESSISEYHRARSVAHSVKARMNADTFQ